MYSLHRNFCALALSPDDDIVVHTDNQDEWGNVEAAIERDAVVLLVDDMVDSRWTMTVAAWLLQTHGSGEVWPLALAQTGRGE